MLKELIRVCSILATKSKEVAWVSFQDEPVYDDAADYCMTLENEDTDEVSATYWVFYMILTGPRK